MNVHVPYASKPVDTRKIRPIRGVALHATIRGSGPVTVNGDNPIDRGERPQQLESFRGRREWGGGLRLIRRPYTAASAQEIAVRFGDCVGMK